MECASDNEDDFVTARSIGKIFFDGCVEGGEEVCLAAGCLFGGIQRRVELINIGRGRGIQKIHHVAITDNGHFESPGVRRA